jgi:predicted phage terminase large subunit-like protein
MTVQTPTVTPQTAAIELLARRQARRDLLAFTTYTKRKPQYNVNWHHRATANVLNDVVRGLLPQEDPDYLPNAPKRVIIEQPPRNGKTELASRRLPAYALGRLPDLLVIACSYGADLAALVNRDVQQIIDSDHYATLFPKTRLNSSNIRTTAYGQPLRNSDIFEVVGRRGTYVSAGIGGPIGGKGFHLGIIDDPVKNRKEADSDVYRQSVWRWYTSTFYMRAEENAAIVIMSTRWDNEDLIGKLLELEISNPNADKWLLISFPALLDVIPDQVEEPKRYQAFMQYDVRMLGDCLWPAKYPIDALMAIKANDPDDWEALQQQRPVKPGGNLFPREKFKIIQYAEFVFNTDMEAVRYWDKAGTQDGGAFTAGVLMLFDPHCTYNVGYIVYDVQRVQYDPLTREQLVKQTAQLDYALPVDVTVWLEQEPGSSGKESAQNTIKNLAGFDVAAETASGAKETRWRPYSAQVKADNVALVTGAWNEDYLTELKRLPAGKFKDQADASAGAFNKLALGWAEEYVAIVDQPLAISPF